MYQNFWGVLAPSSSAPLIGIKAVTSKLIYEAIWY